MSPSFWLVSSKYKLAFIGWLGCIRFNFIQLTIMFNDSSFSFSSLSLSGVQAASGSAVLPPGKYIAKTKGAEIVKTKDGKGAFIKITLVAENNMGVITDRINVFNANAEAVRIGKEQLRALCEFGGHIDPDNLGKHGIDSLNGLRVGINVGTDTYQGETRSQLKGYMRPESVPAGGGKLSAPAPVPAGSIADDSDIPF